MNMLRSSVGCPLSSSVLLDRLANATHKDGIRSHKLRLAGTDDIASLREMAYLSYSPGLRSFCVATLNFHEACLKHGLDDGRFLFTFEYAGELAGGCGLHRYVWGPLNVCWGSWFFIASRFRRPGVALKMFLDLLVEARSRGFSRMYVETPATDDYANISSQLPRVGFLLEATLPGYYAPQADQLIFRLDL